MVDLDRLEKFMRLTEQDSDGESLNALRMANRLLKAADLNWSDVIDMLRIGSRVARKVVRESPAHGAGGGTARYGARASQARPKDTRRHDTPDVNIMFGAMAGARHDMMTMVMLAGFKEHWDKQGYLTGAQYDTLKQIYTKSTSTGGSQQWRF